MGFAPIIYVARSGAGVTNLLITAVVELAVMVSVGMVYVPIASCVARSGGGVTHLLLTAIKLEEMESVEMVSVPAASVSLNLGGVAHLLITARR